MDSQAILCNPEIRKQQVLLDSPCTLNGTNLLVYRQEWHSIHLKIRLSTFKCIATTDPHAAILSPNLKNPNAKLAEGIRSYIAQKQPSTSQLPIHISLVSLLTSQPLNDDSPLLPPPLPSHSPPLRPRMLLSCAGAVSYLLGPFYGCVC